MAGCGQPAGYVYNYIYAINVIYTYIIELDCKFLSVTHTYEHLRNRSPIQSLTLRCSPIMHDGHQADQLAIPLKFLLVTELAL